MEYILHHCLSKFDRSVFLILKPIWNLCGIFMALFLSRNYWSLLNHDLKASIWEKANPIFAGNLNSSLSYLNNHTAVAIQVLRHINCILNLVKLGKALCWRHMFICIMLNHSLQRKYLLQLSEKCELYFLVCEVICNSDQNSGQNPSQISTDTRWKFKVEMYYLLEFLSEFVRFPIGITLGLTHNIILLPLM